MTQYAPRTKVLITLGVAWERTVASKQTLFPVWGDKEDRRPRKGVPEEGVEYTLRATKGVNMHPFPKLVITKEDGTPYLEEEEVKLTLVSANDKMVPNIGSCNSCDGTPILSESKQFQLYKSRGGTCAKIRGGVLEFSKVQIGCCSGNRGHGASFCLKAEFVSENSPLKGKVVYSLPIDVGAKGPFAKVFVREASKNSSTNEVIPSTPVQVEPNNQLIKYSMPTGATYPGAEDMVNLLHKLNLSQYVDLFVEQEVDIQAFLQLTDDDLSKIGITKVGPKVKILKEIARIRGEESNTLSSMNEMPPPPTPTPVAALPPIESLSTSYYSSNTPNILAEDDAPAKRRKLMESFASGNSLADMEFDKNLCIYLYLSNVVASNNILKKTLFMVKTELNKLDTDSVVQQIQQQLISELTRKGKVVIHENKAQLMLMMSPDKVGDWVARAANSDNVWNFKRGDYIKIDNHHNVDIGIQVRYYYVSDKNVYTGKSEKSFIEDVRSPKKYPTVFPGGSLEIGIDDNGNGRLALAADLEFEPTETFAVTKNGKLTSTAVNDPNIYTETCNFSFKRSKNINMKKAESFDDFQKEIFLSRCLEPGFF